MQGSDPGMAKVAGSSQSNRGGSQPGKRRGGRKPGTPNKATAEIKDLARQYAPDALAELARLARKAESESARVAAIKEILDRAYGKAPQAIVGDPDSQAGVAGRVEMIVIESGVPHRED